ncbi:hypothetical protein P9112_007423 [Eukaryota sp. TZLM1-RC]
MDVFSDEEGSSQYPFHSFPESQCSSHLSSTTSSPMNVTTNEFTHGQSLSAQYSQNTELSDRSERKVGVHCQINKSSRESLPTTLISIPCEIKEIHGGRNCSFALTPGRSSCQMGGFVSPYFITDLQNIVFISVHYDSL